MPLTGRVLAAIRRFDLMPPGTRVLAAVSGGADSVALALLLSELAPAGAFTLAALAHFHHGLRGADADADQAFVVALAGRLGVPCIVARGDVAASAAEAGESIEAAARRARYAFLESTAAGLDASRIATGHTADDQAETLLLRLMRGAGLDGLSGIRPLHGLVARPLLEERRHALVAFLRDRGETWREDASNGDVTIPRNRVRHELLPALTRVGGPAVADALARSAALVRDDAAALDMQALELARRVVSRERATHHHACVLSVDIAALKPAGAALARRVLRRALAEVADGRFHALEHVEAVRSLMEENAPRQVQVPGVRAEVRSGRVQLVPDRPEEPAAPFDVTLPVPGVAELPWGAITAEWVDPAAAGLDDLAALRSSGDAVILQGIAPEAELAVRSRRPGDAFRPLGAPGRRKLQDLLVDRKVPRRDRDRVPLVVDGQGRIVWVVGHTIAEECRVSAPAGRVLLLKVRRPQPT